MRDRKSEFVECYLCGKMTHESDVVISPFNDAYCTRCDDLKKKYPIKTRDQLLAILPYHGDNDRSAGVNIIFNVLVVLVVALLIYLFL